MGYEGVWHIMEMDVWDNEYMNMEVQAYIEINNDGTGEFQFGLVKAYMNYKLRNREDKNVMEFRFSGSDELDSISGIGWLKLIKDGLMEGEFSFGLGDDSGFIARRTEELKEL